MLCDWLSFFYRDLDKWECYSWLSFFYRAWIGGNLICVYRSFTGAWIGGNVICDYRSFTGAWIGGNIFCQLFAYFSNSLISFTILASTLATFERYIIVWIIFTDIEGTVCKLLTLFVCTYVCPFTFQLRIIHSFTDVTSLKWSDRHFDLCMACKSSAVTVVYSLNAHRDFHF